MSREEQLRNKRNEIVRAYDKALQPLRDKRAAKEEVDWDLWDKLERDMSKAVAVIDAELFKMGAV